MAEETAKKKLTGTEVATLIGVFSVYACAPTGSIPNVITTELQQIYSSVDPGTFSYFLTIGSLTAMAGAFLFGVLAGKVIKFKTITLIAIILFIVGGVAPAFLPTSMPFILLVACKALWGLGCGCFTPMAQTVIVWMFEDEKTRSYWLGFGGVFFNLAITFGSTIAGLLAIISWQMVFCFYFIGVIPLVLFTIFFKEPENAKMPEKEEKAEAAEGEKVTWKDVPPRLYILMLMFGLAMLTLGFFTSFGRPALTGIGVDAPLFGTIMSARTVGSILVAAIFGFIYKIAGKFCLVVGDCFIIVAFIIFFMMPENGSLNLILCYVAAFCMGFGMNMLTCGMAQILSTLTSPVIAAFVLGFNTLFMNLGTFFSSTVSQVFFAALPGVPQHKIFILAMILLAVAAVVNFIVLASFKAVKEEEAAA